jgi:ABC-type glycerol-3-phosphate transport system substrate-binding protein
MKRRFAFVSVALLTILSVTLGACATPTPEVVEKVVTKEVQVEVTKEVQVEVTKEVQVEVVEESMVVTFMSWAEDDFEVSALEGLIELFEADHPEVTVECEIMTTVLAEGMSVCEIVTVKGVGQ